MCRGFLSSTCFTPLIFIQELCIKRQKATTRTPPNTYCTEDLLRLCGWTVSLHSLEVSPKINKAHQIDYLSPSYPLELALLALPLCKAADTLINDRTIFYSGEQIAIIKRVFKISLLSELLLVAF